MIGITQLTVAAATFSTLTLATPLLQPRQDANGCTFFIDLVNDCQQMYGGSWDICQSPKHTFDIPDCNGATGKQQSCEYFRKDCEPETGKAGDVRTYGGCYPVEGPIPLFAEPQCCDGAAAKAGSGKTQ